MPSAKLPTYQAAISRDHSPGHVIRQVGRKELDDFCTILNRPEPPKGDQLGPITIALNAARNDRCHDPPGRDHARGYAVRGDPEWPEILRQIQRVVGDSGLRGPIMGITAISGRCPNSP